MATGIEAQLTVLPFERLTLVAGYAGVIEVVGGLFMKSHIIAACILAFGLIVAGFLFGGRYYFARVDECAVARGDRWTGKVEMVRNPHTTKCKSWWEREFES